MDIVIYRVHSFNFLILLALKCRYNVHFYRTSLELSFAQKYFKQLGSFSDMQAWTDSLKNSFDKCRQKGNQLRGGGWVQNSDLEVLYQQNMMIELEQVDQFLSILNSKPHRMAIYKSWSLGVFKDEGLIDVPLVGSVWLNMADWLEQYFFSLRKFAKIFLSLFSVKLPSDDLKAVITGISPAEVPINSETSDFSWWTNLGYLRPEQTLYILPSNIQRNNNFAKFRWVLEKDLPKLLPWMKRAQLALSIFKYTSELVVSPKRLRFFTSRNFVDFLLYDQLFKTIKMQNYICSLSRGWPEDPAVVAAKIHGMRSIMWFYSSGEFYYSNTIGFQDINLRFSYNVSDEIWCWSEELKSQFEKRQIDQKKPSKFLVSGPTMNGSFKILAEGYQSLRVNFDVQPDDFLISVFDLMPHKLDHQINLGVGPYVTRQMIESFYEAVTRLLAIDSRIKILVKPKRSASSQFERIENFEKLIGFKDRVKLCPSNINPYIPLGASDFVLSAMITSPSLLAQKMGVPSAYINTTATQGFVSDKFPRELICNSFNELKTLIEIQLSKTRKNKDYQEFIGEMDKFLLCHLK